MGFRTTYPPETRKAEYLQRAALAEAQMLALLERADSLRCEVEHYRRLAAAHDPAPMPPIEGYLR